jgi:hypothetical protein
MKVYDAHHKLYLVLTAFLENNPVYQLLVQYAEMYQNALDLVNSSR